MTVAVYTCVHNIFCAFTNTHSSIDSDLTPFLSKTSQPYWQAKATRKRRREKKVENVVLKPLKQKVAIKERFFFCF